MLKILKAFFGLFSGYAHSFERKVDRFFRNVKSGDAHYKVQKRLFKLMKKNLIVVNVWLEKKYKGYVYLDKKTRRKMYADSAKIVAEFNRFCQQHPVNVVELKGFLSQKGLTYVPANEEALKYLYQIMQFLKPGNYYHYIKTASFGKLLCDPQKAKLEGDCNQIVTLYIYLFGLRFPMDDLQIKLLPEHVCLHFQNIDIEATTAVFENYREYDELLPITEIISTNLLDLSDFREGVQEISERTMLKSAQLANAISSLKSLVSNNLKIAYKNLARAALNSHNFDSAVFFLEKAGEVEGLKNIYHNAAVYYMEQKNFDKAEFYAKKKGDRDLVKAIKKNEGVNFYRAKKYSRALKIFKKLGEKEMEKACYSAMYNEVAARVRGIKTLQDAKKHKRDYKKMYDLALKLGDQEMISSLRKTLNQL